MTVEKESRGVIVEFVGLSLVTQMEIGNIGLV